MRYLLVGGYAVASRTDQIRNKRKVGRTQDWIDVEELERGVE